MFITEETISPTFLPRETIRTGQFVSKMALPLSDMANRLRWPIEVLSEGYAY
jgi:hypothetical protein